MERLVTLIGAFTTGIFLICQLVTTADSAGLNGVNGVNGANGVNGGTATKGAPSSKSDTNILLLCASLSGHLIPTLSLGQELREQGYTVYVAAPYVSPKMPARLLDGTGLLYIPTGGAPESESETSKRNTARWSTRRVSTFTMMVRARSEFYSNDALQLWSMLQAGMVQDEGLVGTTQDGQPFVMKPDFILANHFTSVQTGEYLAQKYRIPLLFNSPQLVWDPMPPPPFHFPIHSAARGLKEMTLLDRMYSTLWYALDGHYWAHHFAYRLATPKLQRKCKCNMTVQEYPEPGVLRPKLVNTVPGFDYALPTPPMLHYTGPLIYPPPGRELAGASPLEAKPELHQWLESWSNASVTVVSMGSHARLSEAQGTALLQGLQASGRPVLWSLRRDNREFLPAGFAETPQELLRFEEWLPQRAVLAHRSVQLFVGHCGFGGTHEALYFGKPMVCIPVMADQPELAARLRDSGAGVSLDVDALTPQGVIQALDRLAGDRGGANGHGAASSYTVRARQLGKLMRLQGGVRKGVEVVEYLLQTGSSDHWVMPNAHMPVVLRYNLDVYAAYAAILLAAAGILRALVRGAQAVRAGRPKSKAE